MGEAAAGTVSFPEWAVVLETASLPPTEKDVFRREIVAFLRYCGEHHVSATTALALHYITACEPKGNYAARPALRREPEGSGRSPASAAALQHEPTGWGQPVPPRTGSR
jgi:hypothetical protein